MTKMENVNRIGCCTTMNPTLTTNSIVVNNSKMHGILHSMQESGKARLMFSNNFTQLKGILLNNCDENFSISGKSINISKDSTDNILQLIPSSSGDSPKFISRVMKITIVDGEVGQEFCIPNVEIKILAKADSTKNANFSSGQQLVIEINNPLINFSTNEVLIGNRAAVEIRKYFASDCLVRTVSRSMNHHLPIEERNNNALYVGFMSINIMTCERTAMSVRRMSVCDDCTTNIIEQSNDFLV